MYEIYYFCVFAQIGDDFVNELYNTIHALIEKNHMTDGSACTAIGLPRSTLGSLKSGRTKSLSQKNLSLFADLLGVSVDSLLSSSSDETQQQQIDNLANSVNIAMYDGDSYDTVPDDIKEMAAAFALAKKQQDYKNPAVKKIVDICNAHPDAVEDILLFAEALQRRSEKK